MKINHRKSIRLKNYDYTQTGLYFITICTKNQKCLFGEIINNEITLNHYGKIVADELKKTEILRDGIKLDQYIIMPNHIHLISAIKGTARCAPTLEKFGGPVSGSIPTIIRSLKSAVTNRIHKTYNKNITIWQRNYYEHIIKNDFELNNTRQYIKNNPFSWNVRARRAVPQLL